MRTTWKGEARLGLTIYALVLITTLCLWGTWYLLPAACVAFGASILILSVRFLIRVYRSLGDARTALSMSTPMFRLPTQETRDKTRS